jgi:hypothetical protein
MPIIPAISAASIGGKVDRIGTVAPARGIRAAAKPAAPRLVFVPKQALALLQRTGLRPPEVEGQLMDPGTVDRACEAAHLSVQERIELKGHLRNAALLSPGKLIR